MSCRPDRSSSQPPLNETFNVAASESDDDLARIYSDLVNLPSSTPRRCDRYDSNEADAPNNDSSAAVLGAAASSTPHRSGRYYRPRQLNYADRSSNQTQLNVTLYVTADGSDLVNRHPSPSFIPHRGGRYERNEVGALNNDSSKASMRRSGRRQLNNTTDIDMSTIRHDEDFRIDYNAGTLWVRVGRDPPISVREFPEEFIVSDRLRLVVDRTVT